MPSRDWIQDKPSTRPLVRRTKGRRATDRLPSLEALLVGAVILAWAWGAYEIVKLFLR